MLIKKISLKNFFCYVDEKIQLKDGVNIIAAENNWGKSAIFSAIKWCFLGKEIIKDNNEIPKHKLFNRKSIINKEDQLSVIIDFEHEGSDFTLKRESKIKSGTKTDTLQDTDFEDFTFMFKDNNAINKNQIEEEIDRILPEYAINTLFFDGEDIRDTCKEVLNIDGRQEKLLDKLRDSIGIPYYDIIIKICKDEISDLKKVRTKKLNESQIAGDITYNLDQIRTIIEETEANISRHKKLNVDFNNQLKEVEREMEEQYEKSGKLVQKNTLDGRKKYHESKRDELVRENKDIISDDSFWESYLSNFLKKNYDNSNESKKNLEIQLEYLKKIEKDISENCKEQIIKFINDVKMKIENFTEEKLIISDWENSQMADDYVENNKNIKREMQDIEKIETEIDKLNYELKGFDEQKYNSLTNRRDSIKKNINDAEKEINNEEDKLSLEQIKEKELEKKVAKQEGVKEIVGEIDIKIDFIEELKKLFDDSRYQHLNSIKNDIQKNSADIFSLITREDDYKAGGLKLDDNWQVSILDKNKNNISLELVSEGTKHCVALSIYAGLFQAIDQDRPFIGDSIFGRLDYEHKANILDQSEKFGSQMILFLTSSEYGDMVRISKSSQWNTFKIDRLSSNESRFARTDLREMDEKRNKYLDNK